ncbi:MAG: nucleotide sugar dehydrogenase [Anaerolineales bacterium]|nr:nucleotide sugar dehydrogenase [Anaerolineales bacterium]
MTLTTTSTKTTLLNKIAERTACLGIIGLGYVGLPSAVSFAEAGFSTIGIDLDATKVKALNQGQSYIEDVPSCQLQPLVTNGRLRASTHYTDLKTADIILICVPTPLRKTKDPDVSYIINAVERLVAEGGGGRGKLIVLESTTYPGTTEELILPALRENGDQAGEDFFLAFSPERIDPGRTDYTFRTTPKVIGGITPACLEIATAFYGTVVEQTVPVDSTAAAEMVKLLENTFRAVNIGLVNEIALMCDKLNLNVWEVIEAAATKPYGFMKFTPGPGLGGHCIPVDPHYLSWKLRTLNYTARFIDLAAEINGAMPHFVLTKISDELNRQRKAINGSQILILGVAYKPNVSDVRESPALDVIHLLQERGAIVSYHDPFVPSLTHEGFCLETVKLTPRILTQADCVVILTDHTAYDWACVVQHASTIIDTRNALHRFRHCHHIVTL